MKNEAKKAKLAEFSIKYKVNFALIALGLFILNGICYEITAFFPLENHHIYMEIDNQIPLIPEFTVFYTLFYILPLLFMTALSFYDKKKFMAITLGGAVGVIICFIVYCVYNVQMIRPEDAVSGYWFFDGTITNFHEFCLAFCHMNFYLDPLARNGIPSLHAMFGGVIFLCGCPFSNKEKHVPVALRIIAMIFGLGVACSTFFVKQHYFIDAVIGFGLAILMFLIAKPVINKIINKYPENKTIKLLTED